MHIPIPTLIPFKQSISTYIPIIRQVSSRLITYPNPESKLYPNLYPSEHFPLIAFLFIYHPISKKSMQNQFQLPTLIQNATYLKYPLQTLMSYQSWPYPFWKHKSFKLPNTWILQFQHYIHSDNPNPNLYPDYNNLESFPSIYFLFIYHPIIPYIPKIPLFSLYHMSWCPYS